MQNRRTIPGQNIVTSKCGIFKCFFNNDHTKRITILRETRSEPAPVWDYAGMDLYPCKLHISLNPVDFNQYQCSISFLLNIYLDAGVIHEYKIFDEAAVEAITNDIRIRKPNKLNDHLAHVGRFKAGDQFTIYLPPEPNKQAILKMTKEIENFCVKNQLWPGQISDAALPLSTFFNMRQDFLLSESSERIDATPFPGCDMSLRKKVVTELMHNKLCQHIFEGMNPKTQLKPNPFSIWRNISNKQIESDPFAQTTLILK